MAIGSASFPHDYDARGTVTVAIEKFAAFEGLGFSPFHYSSLVIRCPGRFLFPLRADIRVMQRN